MLSSLLKFSPDRWSYVPKRNQGNLVSDLLNPDEHMLLFRDKICAILVFLKQFSKKSYNLC